MFQVQRAPSSSDEEAETYSSSEDSEDEEQEELAELQEMHDWFSDNSPEYKRIYLIKNDNKDELVAYIHREAESVGYDVYQSLNLKHIMSEIYLYQAFKCFTALVRGETGLKLDLNDVGLTRGMASGMAPLHFFSSTPEMIELSLRYGARTDVRSESGRLPLNHALDDTSRYATYLGWSLRQSIYVAIVLMCLDLEYQRNQLECVRLLFKATKEVDKEIYRLVKDGKLIEIMSLFMVAREELTSSSLFKGLLCDSTLNGTMSLRQLVLSEIVSLTASQVTLNSTGVSWLELENKLETMMLMLCLIEVFERVGDKLELHCHNLRTKLSEEEFVAHVAYWLISEGFAEYKDFELKRSNSYQRLSTFLDKVLELLESKFCGGNELKLLESGATNIYELAADTTLSNQQRQISSQSYDIPLLDNEDDVKGILPLKESLEKLCRHPYLNDWTPKLSIFKLVCTLCLPQLKNSLESIRLVAPSTAEMETIVSNLVRDGKLIELASLLMVALEKLISTASPGSDVLCSNAIRQCIMSDMARVVDAEARLMGRINNHNLLAKFKAKREMKFSALLLLEVFERAGKSMNQYLQSDAYNDGTRSRLQIAREIQFLLDKSGFHLKNQETDLNDIKCFSTTLDPVDWTSFSTSLDSVDCTISSNLIDSETSGKLCTFLAENASLPLVLQPGEFLVEEKKHLFGIRSAPLVQGSIDCTVSSKIFDPKLSGKLWTSALQPREFPVVELLSRMGRAPSVPGSARRPRLYHTIVQRNSICCSSQQPGIPKISKKKLGQFLSLGAAISKAIKGV